MKTAINIFFIFISCSIILICCKDAELVPKEYPFITMDRINIFKDGATFYAKVESLGNSEVLSFGFEWRLVDSENWIRKNLTEPITGEEFFTTVNSDLLQGEEYVVRPFILTSNYEVYGSTLSFKSNGSRPPEVFDYSPKEVFDGDTIKLKGAFLSYRKENISVFVKESVANIINASEDSLVFNIPHTSHIGSADLRIVVGDHEVIVRNAFNVLGPEIHSISTNEGYSGDIISISGLNFTQNGTTEVFFDDFNAEIIEMNPEMITLAVPIASNYFSNYSANIRIQSGSKIITLHEPFIIKGSWKTKAPTPFSWSWSYKAVTYNNSGYILEMNSKALYSYSPEMNDWMPVSVFPGESDDNNLYFVKYNKLFKIGGRNPYGTSNDSWEYDFNAQSWTQIETTPFSFYSATTVSLDTEELIVTDNGEVWSFDYSSRQFSMKTKFPYSLDGFSFLFKENNEVLLITYGTNWLYDKSADSWSEVSTNAFNRDYAMRDAMGFSLNGIGYVIEDGMYLYKYYSDLKRWVLCAEFPGCRADNSYKTVFVIGSKAYIAATSANFSGCAPLMYEYQN